MKRVALIISGILLLPTAANAHLVKPEKVLDLMNFYRFKGIIDASCIYMDLNALKTNEYAEIMITQTFESVEEKYGWLEAQRMAREVNENKGYPNCKDHFPEKYLPIPLDEYP